MSCQSGDLPGADPYLYPWVEVQWRQTSGLVAGTAQVHG